MEPRSSVCHALARVRLRCLPGSSPSCGSGGGGRSAPLVPCTPLRRSDLPGRDGSSPDARRDDGCALRIGLRRDAVALQPIPSFCPVKSPGAHPPLGGKTFLCVV